MVLGSLERKLNLVWMSENSIKNAEETAKI